MKYFNIFLVIFSLLIGCKEAKKEAAPAAEAPAVEQFVLAGAPLSEGKTYQQSDLGALFAGIEPGDSVSTRFEAEVAAVCQKKGCWMRVNLPNEETVMVRFKDYGFFVPKDISGKRVIVQGKAFVSEVGEEERRHLAEDAGAADSVIAQIRGSEFEKGFEATGVQIFE